LLLFSGRHGCNATFQQSPGSRGTRYAKWHKGEQGPQPVKSLNQPYQRTLRIAPRPFFGPAVDAAGGAAGVNARLQTALDNFARVMGESA
jgi:hypothetical protein